MHAVQSKIIPAVFPHRFFTTPLPATHLVKPTSAGFKALTRKPPTQPKIYQRQARFDDRQSDYSFERSWSEVKFSLIKISFIFFCSLFFFFKFHFHLFILFLLLSAPFVPKFPFLVSRNLVHLLLLQRLSTEQK